MSRVDTYMATRLAEREANGNLRQLPAEQPGIDFRSNDYLGIATNGLLENLQNTKTNKTGATGSRLISGNSRDTEELEATIAAFHKTEAALVFNSGYDANIGLLSAIAARDTTFLYDELCHASIIDGIRQSLCRHKFKFAHNDLNSLEKLLQKHAASGPVIVVVEAIYSMDGDKAPLSEMAALCERYEAKVIADEAHATGVIGAHGEGLVCTLGLESRVFARVHTFGKALGCHGAAVAGSKLLQQYLVNFARSFIYTTALPEQAIHAITSSYQYISSAGFSNRELHDNIAYFKSKVSVAGIEGLKESDTPIQAIVTGGNTHTRQLSHRLQQAGILAHPILHPTVPLGSERLRICLHSYNTKAQMDLLIKHLTS